MTHQPALPESPTFAELGLDPKLNQTITQMGFKEPTAVQSQVFPAALAGKNLWVCAKTGSGKTAAFLIPIMQRLLTRNADTKTNKVLVLVPTRELGRQIHKQSQQLAALTDIRTGLITGGEDFKKQSTLLTQQTDIIIATPGRLIEHIESTLSDSASIDILIIDEADRMLEMGFRNDLIKIAEYCQQRRQTMLFSATLNPAIKGIASALLPNPEKIYLNRVQEQHSNIDQQMLLADDFDHKLALLTWLLTHERYEKAIVFTNTRENADRLRGPLRGRKFRVDALHGDKDPSDRNKTMQFFRDGTINILIATDVAARGIDIGGIDLVVNFDLARNGHDYLHRIGRTGRAGEQGTAIALIAPHEWNVLAGIEHYLQQRLTRRTIKELEGSFKGPKKLKSSGKAAGKKNKKNESPEKTNKSKIRHRDRKNIGKRRIPKIARE